MTDRLFSSLEYKIAPVAPGCPMPTIIQHVRAAAIDVCERTLLWRFEQEAITLTAGVFEYDYDTPSGTAVAAIIHAHIGNNALLPLTQENVHSRYPDWPSADVAKRDRPRIVTQLNPDQFCLVPVPGDAEIYNIIMFLALKPTLEATSMDKRFFDDAEPLILHGALHTLLALPNKSWSSMELSAFHAKQYAYKTGVQRAKANIGMARASLTVRLQPFS